MCTQRGQLLRQFLTWNQLMSSSVFLQITHGCYLAGAKNQRVSNVCFNPFGIATRKSIPNTWCSSTQRDWAEPFPLQSMEMVVELKKKIHWRCSHSNQFWDWVRRPLRKVRPWHAIATPQLSMVVLTSGILLHNASTASFQHIWRISCCLRFHQSLMPRSTISWLAYWQQLWMIWPWLAKRGSCLVVDNVSTQHVLVSNWTWSGWWRWVPW